MSTNVYTEAIENLKPDDNNPNKGTVRGKKLLKKSLQRLGAGRSIVLDSQNRVVSGNKTLEAAKARGHKNVVVVDSTGDTLIAVRRTDLDLTKDKKARELAISDNRVQEVDLSWDAEVLNQTDVDLTEMFDPLELDRLLNEGKNSRQPNTIDLQPPPKMVWVLLGIPFDRFDLVQENLSALEAEAEISVQSARDE